jgi:thiamine-monophosphate kinase
MNRRGISGKQSLSTLGEKGLLHLLTGHWKVNPARVLTGVGDDCAVLRSSRKNHFLLFKTDVVVEGVHVLREAGASAIGRKALTRALSDLAAMGATPLAGVITLGLPKGESPLFLRSLYRGLERAAKSYAVDLVGGETTRARELFLNVALLGECSGYRPILRSGARAGDLIFVTGRLGKTQTRHHLTFTPRLEEGQWLAQQKLASAMMDLSDGLGADLPRLAEASDLSFQLDQKIIPRTRGADLAAALNDGEDYELLFTVAPRRAKTLKKMWPFAVTLHCIGSMRPRRKGEAEPLTAHGFDHFKQC